MIWMTFHNHPEVKITMITNRIKWYWRDQVPLETVLNNKDLDKFIRWNIFESIQPLVENDRDELLRLAYSNVEWRGELLS